MALFFAEAHFGRSDADAIVNDVSEHLRSHGMDVSKKDGQTILTSQWGHSCISVDDGHARIKVEAVTMTGISVLKDKIASHLIEHSPHLADMIAWSGASGTLAWPAWFCLLTVVGARDVTPRMRRIRFAGQNLERYEGFGNIHMRLMFPQQDHIEPQWPTVGSNGITVYLPDDVLAIRHYTFRSIDAEAGLIEVDFVLHDDAGPGSDFPMRARPGDVVGMGGPGGSSVPMDRDWYLLAGDEAALPAIARILETLPQIARGIALIEVADAAEEQSIGTKTQIDIRWLHRNGVAGKTSNILSDAVSSISFPSDDSSVFVWTGCEFDVFKSIRSNIRKDRGLGKEDSLIVSYWRLAKLAA